MKKETLTQRIARKKKQHEWEKIRTIGAMVSIIGVLIMLFFNFITSMIQGLMFYYFYWPQIKDMLNK